MKKRKNFEKPSPDEEDDKKKSASKNPDLSVSSPFLRNIFLFCLVTRIINSLLVQTYFNPDEHWQALEIAHRIAFG